MKTIMRATWLKRRILSEVSVTKLPKTFALGGTIFYEWAGWKEFEFHINFACFWIQWQVMIIDKQDHEKIP